MFGPDKCGEDYKLHFIFRHKHPKTGAFEEKHAKPPDVDLKEFFTDRKTHLYTLGTSFIHSFKVPGDNRLADSLCFQEKQMSLPLRSLSLGEVELCQITTREKMNSMPNRGWGVQKG